MSILDAYRMFQEQQLAQGIDPSVAPRLTQQEQNAMRLAATSPESTTAPPQPSGDVSSPNLFTETREQSQARESVTDDTMSYEQRVNNLKIELTNQMDMLKLNDFAYVNPDDLDYIIDEQAKEFAKAGVDSILDIGKRTEKVRDNNREVEQFTDPNTGNTKYRYTEGMVGFGGTGERTIEVDPSLVREVSLQGSQGSTETMYMATLPSEMPVLYNKKTNERIDVFQGGGTLYGGGDEATIFGDLYSGVEGGAALNIEFMEDGTPLFYPLYKDTSDQAMINAAVLVGSLAIGAGGGFGEIGKFVGAGEATTAGAKAVGAAIVGGGGGFITSGGDFKSAAIGALLAGATTYGIQSGFVGEKLVELGVPESFLNGDNPLGFKIPIGDPALSGIDAGGALQQPGDVSLDTAEGLDYSLDPTDASFNRPLDFNQGTYFGESGLAADDLSQFSVGDISSTPGGVKVKSLFDGKTFADITAGDLGLNYSLDPTDASFDFSDFSNINDAASATTAVDDIIKAAGAGVVTKEAVGKVVEEASKFIDLKEVFGDTAGGVLENLIGTGIDYAGLSALQSSLEERGEDIQKEYEDVFRPYTVTTGFGTGTVAPEGATATVGADYQPLRTAQLDAARGMFEGLPGTREEATAQQLAATRALTEPQRQREQERMLGTLAQRGLLGYGQTMPTVGGQRRVNPLAESILSAQETARSQEALAAQQFGLTEAQRQATLGSGLLTGAQKIDEAALTGLTTGRDISATLQQRPELSGLSARSQYDQLVALSEIEKLRGLTSGAKGLFGLPTQQGNVNANQIQQIVELAKILQPKTATG